MSLKVYIEPTKQNHFPEKKKYNKINKNEISSLRGDGTRPDTNCTDNKKNHAENKCMMQWVRHVLLHFLKGRHLFFELF